MEIIKKFIIFTLFHIPLIHSKILDFQEGQEYIFKITDQHFSAINFKGRIIPPLETSFHGALKLQIASNNSYVGQFFNTLNGGNILNKGDIEMEFLVEFDGDSISNIQVSNKWEKKGIRYIYDLLKDVMRDYTSLKTVESSVNEFNVELPLGKCNATVDVRYMDTEKIIDAKSVKNKCKLNEDLVYIIGSESAEVLTDDTFSEAKVILRLTGDDEPFFDKIELTTNIRGEDARSDFLVAMVSNTIVKYAGSKSNDVRIPLKETLVKHLRQEILEY